MKNYLILLFTVLILTNSFNVYAGKTVNKKNYEDTELFSYTYYSGDSEYKEQRDADWYTISIPKPFRRFKNPHWSGIGYGFNNFSHHGSINDEDGIAIASGNSREITLNLFEVCKPISRNGWSLVTGIGFRWNRYNLKANSYLQEVDGVTQVLHGSNGVSYSKSRLRTTYITFPLLLEWQLMSGRKGSFFVSGGLVGGIKTASSSRADRYDENGKTRVKLGRDLNLNPFTVDFLAQAGYKSIGFYLRHGIVKQFVSKKGPNVHSVSLGVMLHF